MGLAARQSSTGARYDISDELGTAVNVVQMVFGNKGDESGTGVAFTRDPSTGEPGLYGEFLANAQGEDVVAGIRTPEPLARDGAEAARGVRAAARDDAAARGALPGHAGHRVHGRGQRALSPADAVGEAHRGRSGEVRGRHGRRGIDLPRGGGDAHRPGAARPAAASDDRSDGRLGGGGQGAERLAGRGLREDRARRGHCRAARQGGGERDPRPLGDDAGRHPRADPGGGDPHRPRRHDVSRSGRGARDGQAVRRRLRCAFDRPRCADDHARRRRRCPRGTC